MTSRETAQMMLDGIYEGIAKENHLFNYDRSAPVLFEDEIMEILRSIPEESVIECYEGNEIIHRFYVIRRSGQKVITIDRGKHAEAINPLTVMNIIYDLLESDIGAVYIDDTFIADYRPEEE